MGVPLSPPSRAWLRGRTPQPPRPQGGEGGSPSGTGPALRWPGPPGPRTSRLQYSELPSQFLRGSFVSRKEVLQAALTRGGGGRGGGGGGVGGGRGGCTDILRKKKWLIFKTKQNSLSLFLSFLPFLSFAPTLQAMLLGTRQVPQLREPWGKDGWGLEIRAESGGRAPSFSPFISSLRPLLLPGSAPRHPWEGKRGREESPLPLRRQGRGAFVYFLNTSLK